jgi:hypothetical protein
MKQIQQSDFIHFQLTLGSRYPNCSDTETPLSDSLSEQILSELVRIPRPPPLFGYRGASVSEQGNSIMNRVF